MNEGLLISATSVPSQSVRRENNLYLLPVIQYAKIMIYLCESQDKADD